MYTLNRNINEDNNLIVLSTKALMLTKTSEIMMLEKILRQEKATNRHISVATPITLTASDGIASRSITPPENINNVLINVCS